MNITKHAIKYKRLTALLIAAAMLLCACLSITSCADADSDEPSADGLLHGYHYVRFDTDFGSMTFRLDADNAPITVTNFVTLANEGFYDGLTFVRAQKNFVIQGGDPSIPGASKPDVEPIKGEFSANNVMNTIAHCRGVISMARTSDPDSATSSFFICIDSSPSVSMSLDGNYAAFGMIIDGTDVLDAITEYMLGCQSNSMGFLKYYSDQPIIRTVTVLENYAED